MEMESSRRPFDRSRELGLKKPRLNDEPERNPSLNRPFAAAGAAQRPIASSPMVPRFRAAEREPESNDSGRSGGGGYQPQPLPPSAHHQELVSRYREALAELTFNSKPIITNLTIIAGENLHAAKAIAATVCANIIEVPSEQKLPSLYLLDSIVKNIGREYIKNFAARLPEVFCKAYRQVDPPVHQSMRHLFGTWKGVFPPQTLQMIEKELGFSPAVNGTSTGATTSRPDSQSNRPLQNSIHVNPKYLERQQRLQQPSRAKGPSSDLSGSIANSIEDADSMDRATSISTGRSWVDPSVRVHHSQRGGSESIHEKNISAEYPDFDYGSDFPRNSGLGIERAGGRIAEQGHEKNWYGGGSSLAESLSGQRNSFNIKHGFPNYPTPRSTSANVQLQSAKNIATRSSGGISSDSWKNSDEEEFRWSDMNSRLTDHGTSDISSNIRKDRSTSEDSDKSGLEDHIHRPQGTHDYGTRIDKVSAEQKDLGALQHRTSSPWLSQESHSIDGLPHSGTSSFGLPANAVSGSTGALTQRFQSLKSGPSSLRQGPPSPTLTTHHPHLQFQNLSEQDRAKAQSLSHSDSKVSQFPGQLNMGVHNPYSHDSLPIPPSHGRLGKMAKSQPNDIHALSSILTSQQRHQYPLLQQVDKPIESELSSQIQKPQITKSGTPSMVGSYAPDRLNGLGAETLGDSSPSSLLAAVVKSGILSNSSITTSSLSNMDVRNSGQFSSQKGQSALPSGRTPTKFTNTESKVIPASSVGQSASLKISQKKVEIPVPPPSSSPLDSASDNTSNDVKNASDPISNLLSSLVAKGLISASKTESPAAIPPVAPTETQKKSPSAASTSSVPVSSTRDDDTTVSETEPTHSSLLALPKSTKLEIKNLIGFSFKQNVIREFHPTVVSDLLDGYEHRCTICGLQLKLQEQLNRHLEWHDVKMTEANGSIKVSRKWYLRDWISGVLGLPSGSETLETGNEPGKTMENNEPMVPADESQCVCILCGEIFEDFYCQERDEWMFKGAVHMMIPSVGGEVASTSNESVCKGPIVHANCISESSLQDLGLVSRIKTEKDV